MHMESKLPRVKSGLVCERIADETMVYDKETTRLHVLNKTCGLVFDGCRVRDQFGELVEKLGLVAKVDQSDAQALVCYSLQRLSRAGLLRGALETMSSRPLTRRDLIKRSGAVAALLPVIQIVLTSAPSAAQSASITSAACAAIPQSGSCTGLPCSDVANNCCRRATGTCASPGQHSGRNTCACRPNN